MAVTGQQADLYGRLASDNDTVDQISTEFVNNVICMVSKYCYKLSLYLKIRWTLENEWCHSVLMNFITNLF